MTFGDLISGDRFRACGSLWTKLEPETARKHSRESIGLGHEGQAYYGDNICSFEATDEVVFVPPEAEGTGDRGKVSPFPLS